MRYSDMQGENSFASYKKLVNTLKTNFKYDLPKNLVGKSSMEEIVQFKNDVEQQQQFILEGSYEYTNPKYNRNVMLIEALNKLINLLEIRTYRLEPKTGALVNFATAADKLKSLLNPKDNRPDLSYFTADHLNIEEPIKIVGQDDMEAAPCVSNAANQVAPEDNLKKAEVYVGVNDGDPNYTTPTNAAEEEKLAGLTSVEIANIADKVKADVKKDLAKEISDAAMLQGRKNKEVKKTDEKKLGEETMSGNKKILSKLLESEIEKAEIILGVKSITDNLQNMAEKISKMQVEDLAALTERLKAEFGVEMGEQFQSEVSTSLASALLALQNSKSEIDNKALVLSGDHPEQMMGSKEVAPVEAPAEELPGGEEEHDMFSGHEAEAGPEEAPLGRAKKEESAKVASENAIMEAKKNKKKKLDKMKEALEKKGMTESELYKKVVALSENMLAHDRGMGNTKKGSEEKKPSTPHNTAKVLNPKAVNVKKK